MVATFKENPWQNLTLMTLDLEPCQLVPIWLMTLPSEPCHTGDVCMVANFLKKMEKPVLMTRSGTLLVGPDVFNAIVALMPLLPVALIRYLS